MITLLKLDFDGRIPRGFTKLLASHARRWQWPIARVRYDRTRRGWHVIVTVRKRIPPPLIVAAQAILGSDPHRESFNLMRVQQLRRVPTFWRTRWNVLFSSHQHGVSLGAH